MANYPSSANTDSNLYIAANNKSTTLNGAHNDTVTTITVVSTTGFPSAGFISIEQEIISYTGIGATTFTGATRGQDGTTAASHPSGATVGHAVIAKHHNVLKDEIIASTDDLRASIAALDDAATPASTAASLKIRFDQIVSWIKKLNSATNWYDAFTWLTSLDDTVTPAASASNLKVRLDHIAAELKRITGNTNWYDTVAVTLVNKLSLSGGTMSGAIAMGTNKITGLGAATTTGDAIRYEQVNTLWGYRRPRLKFITITTIDVENNTGTAHETTIVFRDGNVRSVTEDTSITSKYRRFIITETAEFTSGTENSGMRSGESEANNTWYAIYVVKSLIDSSKFVLVGSTTLPLQANYSTLNTNFGTDSWIYLGLIRNGDNRAAAGDILNFVTGNGETFFTNNFTSTGNGQALPGAEFATGASVNLDYTYSAGTGATNIPGNIVHILYTMQFDNVVDFHIVRGNAGQYIIHQTVGSTTDVDSATGWIPAGFGANARDSGSQKDIAMSGFIDGALAPGSNPFL